MFFKDLATTKSPTPTTKKHPPDVTLKSQCYFDFHNQHPKVFVAELWIQQHALELVPSNPCLLNNSLYTASGKSSSSNQLSLIYLVKEHWFAKNQKTRPVQAFPSDFSSLQHIQYSHPGKWWSYAG